MMKTRKRGFVITALLIFYIIISVLNLLTFFTNESIKSFMPEKALSTNSVIFYTVLGVIMLLVILGVFLWNKICIYLFGVIGIIMGIATLIIEGYSTMTILSAIAEAALAILISVILIKKSKLPVPDKELKQDEDIWK